MSVSTYDVLNEGVRAWIDNRGWTSWSNIQEKAIPVILAGGNALLVAPTASGKTEAAVLPLVSDLLSRHARPVALLYVSPLRALINDQAQRSIRLFNDNGLTTEWWHSDLPAAKRKAIMKHPPHALFTTPESIDVMLSSPSYGYGKLLANLRYVLIDEIHAFAENDRGAQLMAVLARIEAILNRPLQRVALSATAGNPEILAQWMRSGRPDATPVQVLIDTTPRTRRLAVGIIPEAFDLDLTQGELQEINRERLSNVVARHVAGKRAIVFASSRAAAERLTVALTDLGISAHIHHGSIDREHRAATEASFRLDGPRTIVATSTLELGIDIGDLDLVVQVGVPSNASSILQRIGRSGRRANAQSTGILYATTGEDLPQTLAAADLARLGQAEALAPDTGALHVLFQQILQLVRERDRIEPSDLVTILHAAGSFASVSPTEFNDLLDEMIESRFIERASDGQLGIGPETERRFGGIHYRDLYALFEADEGWTVRHFGATIGTLDRSHPIPEGREVTFILAGRAWRVVHADSTKNILDVERARKGAAPQWIAEKPGASFEVMRHTLGILDGSITTPLETAPLAPTMASARDRIHALRLSTTSFVLAPRGRGTEIITYAGDRLNGYLASLLTAAIPDERACSFDHYSIAAPGNQGDLVDILRAILTDPQQRTAYEEAALDGAPPSGGIGKFWRFFGPRTRRHIHARHLLASGTDLPRLPPQHIIVTARA